MSHFTVLVIGANVERQLQPFHEFECTGVDDEFVVDVDRTEEAIADFEGATVTRFRAPDGTLHDPFDAHGNWKPEFSRDGTDPTFRTSRREKYLPPGYEEVEVPAKEHTTAAEWISGYYGWNVLTIGREPTDDHKNGRIEVDAAGNVVRCLDRTNPNKKWDWWQIGGRWAGYFKLKPGAAGERGKNGVMGSCKNAGPGYADSVRKGDIDFEAMRDDAGTKAAAKWDKVRAITGSMDDFLTWDKVCETHAGDIGAARTAYHEQRARKAIAEAGKTDNDLFWIELDEFACAREQFIERARAGAGVTFAVLKDGQWYERGSMGWWGCVSDEKDQDEWRSQFGALIDGLPDDTLLTVVDCHI